MNRVLLVEDDFSIIQSLSGLLTTEGYQVDTAVGQLEAMELFRRTDYDLVLLDVSLRNGNGFGCCIEMKNHKDIPILFLTASSEEQNVVAGLEMGADDYIAKPFRSRELLSRMRVALRKYGTRQKLVLLGNVSVDLEKGCVMKNGMDLCLSALEYRLLLAFLNNRGRTITRTMLLAEIWDVAGDYVNDNTLTVYIKRLRDKLEDDPKAPTILKTVRGMGYRMD